jgi:hypothetical protein
MNEMNTGWKRVNVGIYSSGKYQIEKHPESGLWDLTDTSKDGDNWINDFRTLTEAKQAAIREAIAAS